jgi:hypothetical protein
VGHTSRSSSLIGVEASLIRVSQSGLKTDEDVTTGGACGTTRRLRRRQAKAGRVDATGCVGPCYPCFLFFFY